MNFSRRHFLKTGSLAITASLVLPKQLFAAGSSPVIVGVQLYTVRDEMKNDPLATLKQVAAAGYKYVEHANYVDQKFYGYTATEFRKVLDDLGLQMESGHTVMRAEHWDSGKKDFTDVWKQTITDAAIVGQQIVISPWLDESMRNDMSTFKSYMDVFNKCGELCAKSGMKFGYHNHDFEFNTKINGVQLYDLLLQNTDPALVTQQLDIGNMFSSGARALDFIKKYPGRFESMHVKDVIKTEHGEMGGNYESTVLGKGILPVKEIIDLGKKTGGSTHFIIEQESYQGKAPIECIKEDLMAMKSWGYK